MSPAATSGMVSCSLPRCVKSWPTPLLRGLRGVVDGRVRPHRPAEDPEHRDVPHERVRDRLEHERRERPGRGRTRAPSRRRPCQDGDRPAIERGGELLHDEVEQAVDADRVRGRAEEDRRERARANPSFAPLTMCSSGSVPCSRYSSIRSSSDSATASISFSRAGSAIAWISSGQVDSSAIGPLGYRSAFSCSRSATPLKSCSCPIGSSKGATWLPKDDTSWSSVAWKSARSRSSLFTKMARGSPSSTASSHAYSVWTSTPSTAETTTMHGVGRPDRASDVADEVGVPGASRTLIFTPFHSIGAIARETRDPASLLVGVVVGDGVAVLDGAHPGDRAGGEEHRLEERGLPRPTVADQQHVADVLRVVGLQRGSSLAGSRSRHPTELARRHRKRLSCSSSGAPGRRTRWPGEAWIGELRFRDTCGVSLRLVLGGPLFESLASLMARCHGVYAPTGGRCLFGRDRMTFPVES